MQVTRLAGASASSLGRAALTVAQLRAIARPRQPLLGSRPVERRRLNGRRASPAASAPPDPRPPGTARLARPDGVRLVGSHQPSINLMSIARLAPTSHVAARTVPPIDQRDANGRAARDPRPLGDCQIFQSASSAAHRAR